MADRYDRRMEKHMSIRAEAEHIQTACDEIEILFNAIEDADDWRIALGLVDEAQRRVYGLRKAMLNEAIRRSQETTID